MRVLEIEIVSLKTYWTLLVSLYPTNATKFSTDNGIAEILDKRHGSITVRMKLEEQVGEFE